MLHGLLRIVGYVTGLDQLKWIWVQVHEMEPEIGLSFLVSLPTSIFNPLEYKPLFSIGSIGMNWGPLGGGGLNMGCVCQLHVG